MCIICPFLVIFHSYSIICVPLVSYDCVASYVASWFVYGLSGPVIIATRLVVFSIVIVFVVLACASSLSVTSIVIW